MKRQIRRRRPPHPLFFARRNSSPTVSQTNEREGSELLLQVVDALRQRAIEAGLVTHLFGAARQPQGQDADHVLMLRAERCDDGSCSFQLKESDALQPRFSADLYAEVFGPDTP